MPVTEVCFEAGYNNISNFNRHFLAEKGVTPSQYRRMSARKFTTEASEQKAMSGVSGLPRD